MRHKIVSIVLLLTQFYIFAVWSIFIFFWYFFISVKLLKDVIALYGPTILLALLWAVVALYLDYRWNLEYNFYRTVLEFHHYFLKCRLSCTGDLLPRYLLFCTECIMIPTPGRIFCPVQTKISTSHCHSANWDVRIINTNRVKNCNSGILHPP